ncbi:hypothetical protein [Bosea thiooxidans]
MSVTMAARAPSGASLSAPVRRRPQPARRRASWLGRIIRAVERRPGRALLLLAFGAVSVAIVANALMLQKARHPAPMLSATPATPSRTPVERRAEPATAPAAGTTPAPAGQPLLPPVRPDDLSHAQAPRDAAPRPPAPVGAPVRAAQPAAAPAPRAAPARDPIADLINGSDLRPPAEIRGAAGRSAAAPRRTAEN